MSGFDSAEILRSTDELSLAQQHFQHLAGKTSDPEAVQAFAFAQAYGHGDIVQMVLNMRQYQMKTSEIQEFTETLNKAATQKEMMEHSANLMRQGRD